MRRPRMTTRRWMIAVAIVAVVIGIYERRRRFLRLAAIHAEAIAGVDAGHVDIPRPGEPFIWVASPRHRWHEALLAKYARAARYPWLPVEADTPEPD